MFSWNLVLAMTLVNARGNETFDKLLNRRDLTL